MSKMKELLLEQQENERIEFAEMVNSGFLEEPKNETLQEGRESYNDEDYDTRRDNEGNTYGI